MHGRFLWYEGAGEGNDERIGGDREVRHQLQNLRPNTDISGT